MSNIEIEMTNREMRENKTEKTVFEDRTDQEQSLIGIRYNLYQPWSSNSRIFLSWTFFSPHFNFPYQEKKEYGKYPRKR